MPCTGTFVPCACRQSKAADANRGSFECHNFFARMPASPATTSFHAGPVPADGHPPDAAHAARIRSSRRRFVPRSLRPIRDAERMWIAAFDVSNRSSTSSTNLQTRVTASYLRYPSRSSTKRNSGSASNSARNRRCAGATSPWNAIGSIRCRGSDDWLQAQFGESGHSPRWPSRAPNGGRCPRGMTRDGDQRRRSNGQRPPRNEAIGGEMQRLVADRAVGV